MGKPKMVWSPIKLWLSNQHKIYPVGRLENVEVGIDRVKSREEFEVIDIIDDAEPYPSLMGIDWDFYNLAILNLKKIQMSFELEDLTVVVVLDLEEGKKYAEMVGEDLNDLDLEIFYKVIAQRKRFYQSYYGW